ncbi:UDP-N-acetylmuramoyl-tripeptide--D-alanyl-D-alanine ligase [Caloramator mitchellensis]|uniref:UDP-N-acetylmuramoyl-tripeptide--D-alanyl-D-alanine ligase n=1 Tax=Caloramator mitchellensis TaxID=908809 RepID=A0A0R3JWM7_CALMK|nr:UDP-N-acetylmuramoyl-tripeptide--D-alanyl-D-alanine ligase [Caloramator mitchellensis]KRQ87939.1 UDP-N-acetylmuramoyl-tripeptide--D-alanyl-D-alanine ligase [Caloramator mitchellensis]
METILIGLSIITFAGISYYYNRFYLHMAQLVGYKPNEFLSWMQKYDRDYLKKSIVLLLLFYIANFLPQNYSGYVLFALWFVFSAKFISDHYKSRKKAKKPLVFTNRAKRLFACALAVNYILVIVLYIIFNNKIILFINGLIFIQVAISFIMLLSLKIMLPIERKIQMGFINEARDIIKRRKDLLVIGVTGSYGKTSVKYFVKTILSEKYNTIMTPESYNTPMGITKVIREQLKDEHEVFVCEMGARYVGDIKELCEIAYPKMGILTAVGPQHLETMGSQENIANTKYELIESLPNDGVAFFNADNEICVNLSKRRNIETYLYGTQQKEETNIWASDIKNTKEGLRFNVQGKVNNREIKFECRTKLLGKHNVNNIIAGILVALRLGLTEEEIKRGIEKIEPVPHRLQLLDTNNGVTVIDDAFNSNPEGSALALEAIAEMEGEKKIIVTPGMIELGNIEYEENKKFGKRIAKVCDIAILVGKKRAIPIIEGLKEENYEDERIIVVNSLDEATQALAKVVSVGDIVLFENDLPDNYSEV